jgi:hypothetical protein
LIRRFGSPWSLGCHDPQGITSTQARARAQAIALRVVADRIEHCDARTRPVQFFSDEYLERCKQMSPTEIVQFLEDFRLLHEAALAAKVTGRRSRK